MNQEKKELTESIISRFANKTLVERTYKVNNERIEKILKGRFLFGFTASDLFILLSAFLTIIFLQLEPHAIPFLERLGQNIPTTQIIKEPETSTPTLTTEPTATPSAQPEEKKTESTTSGEENGETKEGIRVYCESPRPRVCTQECIIGPPYICGSDGKTHCTVCQACAKPEVEWYVFQDEPCADIVPSL